MSASTTAAAPAKSKKKLMIIIGVVVALLVLAGGGAAWLMASRSHTDGDDEGVPAARKETAKVAPTFLPMENMVVNLADPGGDRFVQLGITVEVDDAKTADQVKQYLPAIRSGVLMLVSQRTSAELLQREGKEKLANDILREVSRPLGYNVPTDRDRERERARASARDDDDEEDVRPRRRAAPNPVRRILFSSFIIQ